uniref:hypothetical protein n=1 Tax=Sphingobium sp. Ndbn-10 TaxID=1667223 RepID=UPI0011128CAF
MTRRTVDRLERFGKFLVGASRCEASPIPTQASASKWELNDYLSLQSPSAAYPPFDEAAERSPILLTLPRQRRIAAEWPTIGRDRWHRPAINYLRLFLERQWPADSASEVAKHFQTTPAVLGREFVYRTIHIGADFPAKLPVVEQPVSDDQLVLRMPSEAGADRFFACLFLSANAARDFAKDYEASWSNVSALREIYPANTPRPALRLFTGRNKLITIDETDRGDVPQNVQGDLAELRWSSTAVRPVVAVGEISRDLHPSQARALCEARWSVSLNDDNIVANVFQNNAVPARFADRLFMEIGEARKLDASGKIDPAFPDSLKGIEAVLPSGLSRVSPEDVALTDLPQDAWLLHSAGRYYRLVTNVPPGGTLSITDRKSYDQAWTDGMIRGIVPVAYKQNDRTHNPTSYFEEIDLRPQVILEEYWQWQALYDEEVAKTSLAKKVLAALEAKDPKDLAYDEIIQSAELHRKLASGRYDARIALDTLRERAARLGYVLAIGFDDPVIERKDSTGTPVKITLTPGTLYQRFERVGTYTERVIEPWCVLHGWHPGWHSHHHYRDHYCCRHFERTITHVYNYVDYLPITITNEPWAAKRDQLTAVGFRCIMVSLRDDGYYADDGSPLVEIMRRAEADEAFREQLALFLPIFQDRLNQGRVLVKYLLIVRPSPGYSPSLTPSLFCEEELSYRAEWTGTELGELLHSVSLAPGEERTVTISRAV